MYALFIVFIVLVSLLILAVLAVYLWWKWRIPKCGGYLDPSLRWCDNGRLVTGTPIPDDCNPTSSSVATRSMLRFVGYVTRLSEQASANPSLATSLATLGKTYQGFLLFAVPDLLQLLPSDFGQNYTTPYGMISFYDTYLSCIDDPAKFCEFVAKKQGDAFQELCTAYFQVRATGRECPFGVTDNSSSVWINDPNFFNALGLLGAFSLTAQQVVVFYTDLPVADLDLNYWSYVVYLADSLDPNSECSPRQQVSFASLSSPLNMLTAVGISGKKFNPLTAETGTVTKGHVKFYTVIALDPQVAEAVRHQLETSPPYPVDFVHTFPIPSGPNSTRLDSRLENPNHLTTEDPAYHPSYQRLACFLRLSPSPTASPVSADNLQDYIFARGAYTHNADVVLLEMPSLNSTPAPYISYPLVSMISPRVDEVVQLSQDFGTRKKAFVGRLQWTGYSVARLTTRNSTLNIFAPLYRNVLRTHDPYLGGFQAIQLAGNGQGDNPDAQYRLSESACLLDSDVLVAFCVNHAHFGNALYNSVNILDTNRAYGYGAVVVDASLGKPYYLVLAGRNHDTLNQTEARVREGLSPFPEDIFMTKIPIRTGPSQQGDVPLCHQLLMVERTYVNPSFASLVDPDNTRYHVTDLFGPKLDTLNLSAPEAAWQSLVNVGAPTNATLLPPAFFKVSYSPKVLQCLLLITVFVLVLLLAVGVTAFVYLVANSRRA